MYIEEITIEGFKSYATRVNVPGFDRYFNAITGLNGSGKSNILDSICFVLGITNLSQVRASSLQELVYKQGQAGITKASVSIVFNNEDKTSSPVSYEAFDKIAVTRQLVIGGRSKYLINGHVAQPGRVQNLFHSVQLNVNNPHFLIMQGRITKVLNMKPIEILGMLEEAAGTRMYESKKDSALRTLEKKQIKVEEINTVLAEEILPSLERLRREKGEYMQFQAAELMLDRLRRFVKAYSYTQALARQQAKEKDTEAEQERLQALEQETEELEGTVREREAELKALKAEKELQSGGEVRDLKEAVEKLNKQIVKDTTVWTNKKENLDSELASCAQMRASLAELASGAMEARAKAAADQKDAAAAALEAAEAAVEAASRELAGAEAGDGRDESNRSLQERLTDAMTAQTTAAADGKQAEARATHFRRELKEQKALLSSKSKQAEAMTRKMQAAQAAVDDCKRRLDELEYNAEAAQALEATREEEQAHVEQCRQKVDALASRLSALDFRYTDPDRNFDRKSVRGTLARLFTIKDDSAATALEVAAGGKLWQVVVDTEACAKALLARGRLQARVTIIPLNKVSSRGLPASVVAAAQRIAPGRATPAQALVEYEPAVGPAVQYCFGGALVCKDISSAKALAFHREVSRRCVTLQGDDYDPSGTLTGGSRKQHGSVLARVKALAEAERELDVRVAALRKAEASLNGLEAARKAHEKLNAELEIKGTELQLLQDQARGSETAQLADAVAATEAALEEAAAAADAARQHKADMAASAQALEKEIANFGKERGSHIAAAKKKLQAAKEGVGAAKGALKDAQSAMTQAAAELEAAAGEKVALEQQIAAAEKVVEGLQKDVEAVGKKVADVKTQHDDKAAALEELRVRLRECDAEMAGLVKEQTAARQRLSDIQVDSKRTQNKLARIDKESRDAQAERQKLEQECPWIASEKQLFGRPGGDYDWNAQDPKEAVRQFHKCQDEQQGRKKALNNKVMQMFDKAEAEYAELSDKRRIVEADKAKIEKVIAELDEKKREALEKTWKAVNGNFGSIFSTLLPGTSAKLEPPEGESFLAGLEVRVAFGGVWKESLTELSGGQRSLLALSLILAMLKFKPAPIYILDEVDAALDLSHTQNIGAMIKSHFPQSQFIVVSLKEGMFSNANVLFRTKFVDGVSAVSRSVTGATSGRVAADHDGKGTQRSTRIPLAENQLPRS
ncbi:hypothetical protein WJX73_005152 [Symbiochloris irregularis]|uniref:Structural maintenance of chromosomes protein n=1 Tax=Symbiochloris irregularis TaxID=706552 RepID=A0AAW1PBW6_9CHLO